jgi:hypothetical protein
MFKSPHHKTYHIFVEANKFAKLQHCVQADPGFDSSIYDDVDENYIKGDWKAL